MGLILRPLFLIRPIIRSSGSFHGSCYSQSPFFLYAIIFFCFRGQTIKINFYSSYSTVRISLFSHRIYTKYFSDTGVIDRDSTA